MNKELLISKIESYIDKQNEFPEFYKKEIEVRNEKIRRYRGFTKERISELSREEMYEYIGNLWSMLIWGNKQYIVDKIVDDNTLEKLRNEIINLIFGSDPVEIRWDIFAKEIKGLGPATMSELLTYNYPDDFTIFNRRTVEGYNLLGIGGMPTYNYQYTGKKFVEVCKNAKYIAGLMKEKGLKNVDLLMVDYFIYDEILPLKEAPSNSDVENDRVINSDKNNYNFIHDEIRDKIVEIGHLLGLDARAEVMVSNGAKVDVIWEAKIGNMGKSVYVFEVQSKGSIDSLLLNLIKAHSNPAVQSIVAVSGMDQLEKIKRECVGTSIQDKLKLWDQSEIIHVHDSLVKAHESINKLGLVPEGFLGIK